jgi:hypothetical protein
MLKRLDLPDGQWADLLAKPRHAEHVAITEAAEEAERRLGTWTRWAMVVGQQYTKAWSIRDEEGQPVKDGDWSRLDPDIADAICTEAQNRYAEWQAGRVPLVTRRVPSPSAETPAPSSDATSGDSPSG